MDLLSLYKKKVKLPNISFTLNNSLFYYKGKLVVLKDKDIRIYLIWDIYV